MITRGKALRVIREAGCSETVILHCLTVERTALSIAKQILANGHRINIKLVSLGALLHDIGRSRTHSIKHGIEGGKILRSMGLKDLARFAERHIGAGIPAEEAKKLGLPARDFIPKTLEEKVVTYADKLAMGSRRTSYSRALEWLKSELGKDHPAIERLENLHREIQRLAIKS